LSKFALEVAFNPKTTFWTLSYDGRKQEPITLPMKFPLLLAQGADGIAVGLSTKILPHNFCEIIEASIKHLRGKKFELLPDFQTKGKMDASNYNDGKRGGKIRVRATIEEFDKKTLLIKDVPYSVTTTQLMESITKANDQIASAIFALNSRNSLFESIGILKYVSENVHPRVSFYLFRRRVFCALSK
jgi:topoisomerase-4 subunit A